MKYTEPIIKVVYFGAELLNTAAPTQAPVTTSAYAADVMGHSMKQGINNIIQTNSTKVYDIMNFQ